MSQTAQEGLAYLSLEEIGFAELNLEEIDDYNCFFNAPEGGQDNSYNNTCAPDDNNYNSEYNVTFRNDEIQPFTCPGNYQNSSTAALPNSYLASDANSFGPETSMDSFSSESASATDSLSSDFASTMVFATSNASSAVSLPVKQRLNGKIKMKMRAEGRPDTPLSSSSKDSVVDKLTPEEEQKRQEKQQRNKESARRSRQKKKEEDEKLLRDNKRLMSENEELKNDVALLKLRIDKFEEFFPGHPCMLSPQQDNGDKICVDTGRSKVCGDDAESGDADDKAIETILEFANDYGVPIQYHQGPESQQKLAIMSELAEDRTSQMVTSVTAYVPEKGYTANDGFNIGVQENIVPNILYNVINREQLSLTANGGFGIGIQENVFPPISHNVTNHEKLETVDGAIGGNLLAGSKEVGPGNQTCMTESIGAYQPNTEMYNANSVSTYQPMSHGMSAMTGEVAQTNNPAVPMVQQSQININPWCTGDGNQSEAEEALRIVQDFSPPPVKKIRLE